MTPELGPRLRGGLLANPAECGGANSVPGDLVRLFTMADVNRDLPLDRNDFIHVRSQSNVAGHQLKL